MAKIPGIPGLPFDNWRNRAEGADYQARQLDRLLNGADVVPVPGSRELMSLGMFVFGFDNLAYDSWSRRQSWRHASSERFLARPASQYVGPGEDSVSLPGVLVPEVMGSTGAIFRLVEMAGTGDNWPLVDGRGVVWGNYRIIGIDQTGTVIMAGGIARKIDFTIDLERAD